MSTRHHWADIFIVRRQGPDGRKGSTMNSTATCSTWRGMGSVTLYLPRDSPCHENKQPYHTGAHTKFVRERLSKVVSTRWPKEWIFCARSDFHLKKKKENAWVGKDSSNIPPHARKSRHNHRKACRKSSVTM